MRQPNSPNEVEALASQTLQRYLRCMERPVVSRASDVMGGTPVFAGTRVPVETLLDYLEAGDSIDDFLEGFPTVTREAVLAFLEETRHRLNVPAS